MANCTILGKKTTAQQTKHLVIVVQSLNNSEFIYSKQGCRFKTCLAVSLCNGSISRRVSLKDNGYSVMAGAGVDPIVSPWSRLLTNNEYRAGGPNLINLMEPQSLPYQSRSCTRSTKLHCSDQKLMILKSGIIGCNEYDHMSEEYKSTMEHFAAKYFPNFFKLY